MRRRREIGIRLALGISRARLAGLFLLESLILSGAAAAASLVVASGGGAALRRTLMPDVAFVDSIVDARLAVFAFAIAGIAALCTGLPVALRAGRDGVGLALASGAREGGPARSPLRASLVAAQVALSIMLLVGAAAFVRSFLTASRSQTGYDLDRLLLVQLRYDDGQFRATETATRLEELAARLGAHPGVERVALSGVRPLSGYVMSSVFRPDGSAIAGAGDLQPSYMTVSPGYFRTAGIGLLRGRDIDVADGPTAPAVMVVNRSMARTLWPEQDAIGQCLRFRAATNDCRTVIGIVEDTNRDGLVETVGGHSPQYFVPLAQATGEFAAPIVLIVRSAGARAPDLQSSLASGLRGALPAGVYASVTPIRETFARQLRPWTLGATLFTAFGLLALLVATIGTYSTAAYAAAQRTREIGIRVALGAPRPNLVRLVTGQGLKPVLVGAVVGVGLAVLSSRLIESLLYQTSPSDPSVIMAASTAMIASATAGCVIPAVRAARVDPIVVLKDE
jgi:predicted permease